MVDWGYFGPGGEDFSGLKVYFSKLFKKCTVRSRYIIRPQTYMFFANYLKIRTMLIYSKL